MKKIVLISLTIMLMLLACLRTNKENRLQTHYSESGGRPFPYIISDGKLGNVSIGDGIDTTLQNLTLWFQVKIDSITSCEGCEEYTTLYKVYPKDSFDPIFTIEPGWEDLDKDKVFRITTTNEQIVTDKSIKVGMTIGDLKKEYEIVNVDCGGETGLHIIVKDFQGSFGISIPDDENWWSYNSKTIPDSLRIEEIILI